jgi:hypothetical protein
VKAARSEFKETVIHMSWQRLNSRLKVFVEEIDSELQVIGLDVGKTYSTKKRLDRTWREPADCWRPCWRQHMPNRDV